MTKEASHPTSEKTEPKTAPAPETRRLYRSSSDRVIGGVAGGLAEYFSMDSSLMRLIFIILVLMPGIGVIAYIIAWVVIPEEPKEQTEAKAKIASTQVPAVQGVQSQRMLGLILVVVGLYFLLHTLINFCLDGRFWPLILIVVGLFFVLNRGKRS
jgi:phage shock protein PspC (stress-responsive transcriptional regulator)